ncbi:hypothetical protein [Sphingorhabdus sp. SMR4y]|uniref:hypothetical protein n=1 Tax=Sphingorhabdus sp. SMR4y TaxID=2584094 RepID=UPI000B614BC9|nr:hypothetical protein [Sphingorhabdus sp. SMR4y]ASK88650.1 hypothetical protein SPHFLASMR4Y_01904 [Sphingorhabdus sp. SMR4y]
MCRIWGAIVPVILLLAIAPASAAGVPDLSQPGIESAYATDVAVSRHSPVAEFWQLVQSELAGDLQELQESIKIELAAALEPTGEAEADWNIRGMDLVAHIESLPGGVAGNAVLTLGETPSLEFFGKIPADILADWDYVQSGPKAVSPLAADGGVFVAISPSHLLFLADDEIRTGNASCMTHPIENAADHVTVYRYSGTPFDPDSDASLEAEAEAVVMHSVVGGLGSPVICSVYRQDEEGRLLHFAYLPDGRPLGLMDDDQEQLEIVSGFNLYQQLNANYVSGFGDDEPPEAAEEARDDL